MSRLIGCMIVLLLSLNLLVPSGMAQVETSPQTIKGDLLVYLHVDKNTKHERLLVPGEKIEVDVICDSWYTIRRMTIDEISQ